MAERMPIFQPRGLRETQAAEYVGLSPGTFRKEVEADRAPKPIRLTAGRIVWLRDMLDDWLDRLAEQQASAASARDLWQESIEGGQGGPALP